MYSHTNLFFLLSRVLWYVYELLRKSRRWFDERQKLLRNWKPTQGRESFILQREVEVSAENGGCLKGNVKKTMSEGLLGQLSRSRGGWAGLKRKVAEKNTWGSVFTFYSLYENISGDESIIIYVDMLKTQRRILSEGTVFLTEVLIWLINNL